MKNLLILMMFFLIPVVAEANDSFEGLCDSVFNYSKKIMNSRQKNIDKNNIIKIHGIIEYKDKEISEFLSKDIIEKAYAIPLKKNKEAEVKKFSDQIKTHCDKGVNETNNSIYYSNLDDFIVINYVIESGDTLAKISQKFNVDFRDIARWNNVDPNATFYVGGNLKIIPNYNNFKQKKDEELKKELLINNKNSEFLSDDQYCKTESWFAMEAMKQRQKGATKTKVLQLNRELYERLLDSGHDDRKGYLERIEQTNRAFLVPVAKSEKAKVQAVLDFANEYFYKCLGNY